MLSAKMLRVFAFLLAVFSTTHALTKELEAELSQVEQDVTTYQYHKDFKTCPVSLDIGYLIDGSSSIKDDDFELQKTVVKIMAYFFGVMKLGTHDGVIVYADSANADIKLTDHHTFEGFRQAVKALKKRGGGTRIDVAIEAAHDYFFGPNGGARTSKHIEKVAIVFSGGDSGGQSLDTAVQQLRGNGVITFAIGIGDIAADLKSLVDRDDLVYRANDFLDLYINAGLYARLICQHIQNLGSAGPQGSQGPDGPTGIRGPAGVPGPDGARGSIGPHGQKGQQGISGPSGEDGIAGAPGASGAPGPQGVKGPKGARGDAGATGRRGEQGDNGYDGDQGARGLAGDQGPTGLKGEPGEPGLAGADGTDGLAGLKGDAGLVGDQGDSGRAGADGDNGARGPKGQPGQRGAAGAIGAPGATGPKGDGGSQGPNGVRGSIGEPGAPGPDGDGGADGDAGDAGARGARGLVGPSGEPGAAGIPGVFGANGADGPRGSKGNAGIPGIDTLQNIVCQYKQSDLGQDSMSCNDATTTVTDCGCARGCAEWSVSDDGQTCSCLCNTYVPQHFHQVGVNCCKIQ